MSGEAFHQRCDNKGPTLVIYQSETNQILGGFTQNEWKSRGNWFNGDNKTFIFSLDEDGEFSRHNFTNKGYEIYDHANSLPSFGNDIYIKNDQITSYLGSSYALPEGVEHNTEKASSFRGGLAKFKLKNIEVY